MMQVQMLKELPQLAANDRSAQLAELNANLEALSAQERVSWALENLPGTQVLSSSFGIQSAVLLHMLTQQQPNIPVVMVDTGYLFPETYQFIDELSERLKLNLKVYRNPMSPAWQEARFGHLWESGIEGIEQYNKANKVEPMKRAMSELDVSTWYSGLRRSQSSTRAQLPVLDLVQGRYKVLPIIDWSNKDVHYYLKEHGLPYHPLWDKGYVSVGDVHTSRPLQAGMTEEETRFFGLKRECGLHEPNVDGDGI